MSKTNVSTCESWSLVVCDLCHTSCRRQSGEGIGGIIDAGDVEFALQPVLGTEQRSQLHLLGFVDQMQIGLASLIDPRLIRNQADPLALEDFKAGL